MEFTLARKRATDLVPDAFTGREEGLVIVSEFISSARVMRGALTVNPWNTHDVRLVLKIFCLDIENYSKIIFCPGLMIR